jgi:predicted phosphodiesterase
VLPRGDDPPNPPAQSVAVLADIHGNLPALDAVLAEPEVAAADRVVLLGDIALGPMPGPTLDRLAELGDRAIWVHGNCEREMVTAYDGGLVPGAREYMLNHYSDAEALEAFTQIAREQAAG